MSHSLDLEARKALLDRIASSARFQKAPRLRQMLSYVGERSLDDEQESPREVEIGIAVFGRGTGYVPSDDNIVRNAARQLRVKLKEYFEEEGFDEPWTLEIPKGGYRAVFVPRMMEERPAEPIPAVEPTAPARRRAFPVWGWALLALSVALNVALFWRPPVAVFAKPEHLAGLLANQSPWIVVGDYGSFLNIQLEGRPKYTLDEYINRAFSKVTAPSVQAYGNMLATRQIVSMGEMNAALALLDAMGRKVEVRHARTLAARDLRRQGVILLGTNSTNPWFDLYEDNLRFRMTGRGFTDTKSGREYEITQPSASGGRGYVRVAVLPALGGTGQVMIINGVNMGSVESGAEFAASADALRQLRAKPGFPSAGLPNFEAILETTATDFTPNQYRLVEAHVSDLR